VNKYAVPGPGQYPLVVKWQGKEEGIKKETKRQFIDFVASGPPTRSIYY
jgi:hypothetical protein